MLRSEIGLQVNYLHALEEMLPGHGNVEKITGFSFRDSLPDCTGLLTPVLRSCLPP